MKMIRVGSSTQSRIAQACDRCRSKKIRCDGVRPTCSQCSNVGFECKTSDKLSRRAFPRGYTESLEDRVRGLEAEVRELKQLLDEKDEKIDMLSRIHSFSPMRKNSASLSPANSAQIKAEVRSAQEEVLHVEIPAPVHPATTSGCTSTTSALIEAFESKVEEQGRQCPTISPSNLLTPAAAVARPSSIPTNSSPIPPRLLSDQYISRSIVIAFMVPIANKHKTFSSKSGNHFYPYFIVKHSCVYMSNSSPIRMRTRSKATNWPSHSSSSSSR